MDKKKRTFPKQVFQEFIDYDYKSKLSPEERAFLDNFTDDFYSNAINKEDSLHRQRLTPEQFEKAKKDTFDATNARNRDLYAQENFTDDLLEYLDERKQNDTGEDSVSYAMKIKDLESVLQNLFEETLDIIEGSHFRETKIEALKNMTKKAARALRINKQQKRKEYEHVRKK